MKALMHDLFCLPLWETDWKWIILSHRNLTSRSCLKAAPSQLLNAVQSVLDVLSRLENTLTRCYIHELPYRGFCSLSARLPRQIEMFTEVLWQHLFQVQKVPYKNLYFVKQVVISNQTVTMKHHLLVVFLVHSEVLRKRPEKCTWGLLDISLKAFWCYEWA